MTAWGDWIQRTPLTREHFAEFEKAFGKDPWGKDKRKGQGEAGRFRCFTREQIAKRGDNLDIAWLRDEDAEGAEALPEPEVIVAEIMQNLTTAMEEMEELQGVLGDAS